MEYFYAFIALFAGLGALLLGFKLLSGNTEKLASGGLKRMFSRISDRKLVGVGIGLASTAIVQSSAVTTVMVVGFVNAGIMTLSQATTVIMGANIGTTVTAQIVALQAFDVVEIATVLTAVGMFIDLFAKKDRTKSIGLLLAGLGLVFMGLNYMSDAMNVIKESEAVINILSSITNPFLLLLIGIVITALVQSSSAVTSIIISMASAGIVIGDGGNCVLFLILGTNIGTCVTAMLSAIGANRNAKRACSIHLMFNVIGALIFFIVLLCWPSFMDMTFASWFSEPSQQIAMFHTFFNVVCVLLFLPFTELFVKLSGILVREKKAEPTEPGMLVMDKRLLMAPSVAIDQLGKATLRMADYSMANLKDAFYAYLQRDEAASERILEKNEEIAGMYKQLTDYLVQVSGEEISLRDEQIVTALHHNLGDIVRISEIADNFTKYTRREVKYNLVFSSGVDEELEAMFKKVEEMYAVARMTVEYNDLGRLAEVDALEDEVDAMRKKLVNEHIERLNGGYCKAENSSVFINLVSNLERVGDHLSYLAHSVEERTA